MLTESGGRPRLIHMYEWPNGSTPEIRNSIKGWNNPCLYIRALHRTNVRYVRREYSPRTPIERTRMSSHSLFSIREWPPIRTLISEWEPFVYAYYANGLYSRTLNSEWPSVRKTLFGE